LLVKLESVVKLRLSFELKNQNIVI